MSKKVAILQSNYIPWKGYFDIIAQVDEFILYDEMQYTKNDWRNRNKIKTSQGLQWITIPVIVNNLQQKIFKTKVANKNWIKKHKNGIKTNYSKAKHYKEYESFFFDIYDSLEHEEYLSNINFKFISNICNLLEIKTKISWSSDYNMIDGKTERLIDICKQAGASEYISGPAAKNYIDSNMFKKNSIKLTWMDYNNYSEYTQLFPPFNHGVSIIDLIFNEGTNSRKYMKF